MGFKFGIYSSGSPLTCEGYPASLEHEEVDARASAEWGVDYLKYDNCKMENAAGKWYDNCAYCQSLNDTSRCSNGRFCPPGFDYTKSKTFERYTRMKDALAKVDRPIFYSLCEWGSANVATWGNQTAQS
jgi:alpha-galactosidase